MGEMERTMGAAQKEFQMERDDLRNMLTDYDLGGKDPNEIIALSTRGREHGRRGVGQASQGRARRRHRTSWTSSGASVCPT